jgi:hypothetical protein
MKIHNHLKDLLVSDIFLFIAKLGMENALNSSKYLVNPDKANHFVRRGTESGGSFWGERWPSYQRMNLR